MAVVKLIPCPMRPKRRKALHPDNRRNYASSVVIVHQGIIIMPSHVRDVKVMFPDQALAIANRCFLLPVVRVQNPPDRPTASHVSLTCRSLRLVNEHEKKKHIPPLTVSLLLLLLLLLLDAPDAESVCVF